MNKPVNQLRGDGHRSGAAAAAPLSVLMVDRIIDIRGDEHGVGIKNVTINEPHFQGHFPGNPAFPGVLHDRGHGPNGGCLCIVATGTQPTLGFFSPSTRQNFASPCGPATPSVSHADRITRRKSMWWYRGEAKVAGEVVAEAQVGAIRPDA